MQKYQYRNHGLLKEVDEHLHVPLKFYSLLTGKLVSRFPTHHQSCKCKTNLTGEMLALENKVKKNCYVTVDINFQ